MSYSPMEIVSSGGVRYDIEAQRAVPSGTVGFVLEIQMSAGYASEADWDDVMQELVDYFAANFANVSARKQYPAEGYPGAMSIISPTE